MTSMTRHQAAELRGRRSGDADGVSTPDCLPKPPRRNERISTVRVACVCLCAALVDKHARSRETEALRGTNRQRANREARRLCWIDQASWGPEVRKRPPGPRTDTSESSSGRVDAFRASRFSFIDFAGAVPFERSTRPLHRP